MITWNFLMKKLLKIHTVNKNYMPKGFTLVERIDEYNIIVEYVGIADINALMDYQNIVEVEMRLIYC